jgi:hypothetical protein
MYKVNDPRSRGVGMRANAEYQIFIDLKQWYDDGYMAFRTAQDAILFDRPVPLRYFRIAYDVNHGGYAVYDARLRDDRGQKVRWNSSKKVWCGACRTTWPQGLTMCLRQTCCVCLHVRLAMSHIESTHKTIRDHLCRVQYGVSYADITKGIPPNLHFQIRQEQLTVAMDQVYADLGYNEDNPRPMDADTVASSATIASIAHSERTEGGKKRRNDVAKWNQRHKHAVALGFKNHSDRYDKCGVYTVNCDASRVPRSYPDWYTLPEDWKKTEPLGTVQDSGTAPSTAAASHDEPMPPVASGVEPALDDPMQPDPVSASVLEEEADFGA